MSCKSSIFLLSSLTAAMVTLTPSLVMAAENELETVYVSATRSETAQLPVATQITIITAEEIRLSGARLLSEVLRSQASIQLSDNDGSGGRNVTASMRGLSGANNVLVLVDGRKLNNPSMAAPALNTVSLKDVERIEVVQGSAGVLYGDQAIGGVINIITRRAKAGEINGFVGASSGSFNLEDYTASVNQGFENGLSYSASAQKRNADNYRDNNQNAYENILGNVRYDFAKGFVFVEGQKVDDELRLPGSISDAQALLDPRQTFSPNDFNNQDTNTWLIGGGASFTDHWSAYAEYSDRDEEGKYFFYGLTQYSMRVQSLTPRVVGSFATTYGNAVATFGYDEIGSEYESSRGLSADQQQRSYYGQVVYPLLSKLTATLGARHAQVKDENNILVQSQKDHLNASEFGLNYELTPEWRTFGRYAESFRFANPDDNAQVPATTKFLNPQTGESWELGAEWKAETALVSYSLYKMNLNGEIVYDGSVPNNQNGIGANINLPDSERQGLMLDAGTQLSQQLNLRINYTYTDAEVVSGAYKGKEVPFVSKHTGTAVLVLIPAEQLSVSFESVYTGSRYKAYDESNSGVLLDSLVVFNASVIYVYDEWDFGARINNITNELYAGLNTAWGQYPQPERNYAASVSYRF